MAISVMELEAYSQGFQFHGGIDEAGRGPWQPVVAACAILRREFC